MKSFPAPDRRGRFAASWNSQVRRHRRLLGHCRRQPSGKNVHELRIATRRLLARLQLSHPEPLPPALQRGRRQLKQLMDATAPARDARVQLHLFERLIRGQRSPGAKLLCARLKKRGRRRIRELAKSLKGHGAKIRRFLPEALAPVEPAATGRLLGQTYRRLQARLRAARTGETSAQHRARLTLKKLRYLVEAAAPAGPAGRFTPPVRRLHAIQSALGELHDFDLLLVRIEKYAARHKRARIWLQTHRARLQRRRQALLKSIPPLQIRLTELSPALAQFHRKELR